MLSLRVLLVGLVLLASLGLAAELALLEHYGTFLRTLPFGVLALALGSGAAFAYRPGRSAVRVFRATMALLIATGLAGVWLHYDENAAFERELNPDATGFELVWLAVRGATPLLAPGAMVQLGLLGLIAAYSQHVLRRVAAAAEDDEP